MGRTLTSDKLAHQQRQQMGKMEKRQQKKIIRMRSRYQGEAADTQAGQATLRSIGIALLVVFAGMYALFLLLTWMVDDDEPQSQASP